MHKPCPNLLKFFLGEDYSLIIINRMISASNWIKLTTNRILGMVRFCTVVCNSEIGTCVNAKPRIKMRKRFRIKI